MGMNATLIAFKLTSLIGLIQYMDCHAIFDAPGHVQILSLGIEHPLLSLKEEIDCQERRVADHVREISNLGIILRGHYVCSIRITIVVRLCPALRILPHLLYLVKNLSIKLS